MKAIKDAVIRLSAVCRLEGEVRMLLNPATALAKQGWFRSVREKRSVDAAGDPLPWLSYPAIEILRERLSKSHLVFEYGSGGSTLWFASRCREVISIEHHEEWFKEVAPRLPQNARILLKSLPVAREYLEVAFATLETRNPYSDAISEGGSPDLVVIDGIFRNACAAAASERVGDHCVIIFDNTDFPEARPGVDHLRAKGWRQLRFVGMSPILDKLMETSVFYRPGNCWGL